MADSDALHRLAAFFGGLKGHSKLALSQAMQARDTEGVGAVLVVKIPADPAKPNEVYYMNTPYPTVSFSVDRA